MRYKTITETEVLHETKFTIKGKEPFLKFVKAGLIVNFHDFFGHSHNIVETPVGAVSGIPLDRFQKGDTLRLQLCRVTQSLVEEPVWYVRLWNQIRGWWAR